MKWWPRRGGQMTSSEHRASELSGYLARAIYELDAKERLRILEKVLGRPPSNDDLDDLIIACRKPTLLELFEQ